MAIPPSAPDASSQRVVRIAILDDYQRAAQDYFPLDDLSSVCQPELTIYTDHAETEDELVARAGHAEVVVIMRERSPFPRRIIERLDHTKMIVTSGQRNAAIDTAAAREHGIVVTGTRGKDSAPAELTWALLLAVVRRVPAEDAGIRSGSWGLHVGDTLAGKTLGIVGVGTIGREVARYGQAFGMRVVAHSRSLTDTGAALMGCDRGSLEMVLRESDVVSLHLRLVEATRHIIGGEELGFMKSSAYLVNTARGGLVDEPALVRALQTGKIRGAGLDVFETEPLPSDSPLRELDNVVMTPHAGYVSRDRYASYFGQAAENVRHYIEGTPIRPLP